MAKAETDNTEDEVENCLGPTPDPDSPQCEDSFQHISGDTASKCLMVSQKPPTNLPADTKQKSAEKNWSNEAKFSAAVEEWKNNRPTNDNGRPVSMAKFCKLRCVPYPSFRRHTMSHETKEAARKRLENILPNDVLPSQLR